MLKCDPDLIKCCWNWKILSLAMKIKELLNEINIWKNFTTFQNILFVFVLLAIISYLTSAWSVIVGMILGIPLALITSEKIQQRNVPFASDFLLIVVQYVKIILMFCQNLVKESSRHGETEQTKPLPSVEDPGDQYAQTGQSVESSDSPVIKAEKILVDLVIRDFVQSWLVSFSSNSQFLEESRTILNLAATNCHHRVSTLPAESLTVSLINLYQKHLQSFQKSKHLYECQKSKVSLSVKEMSTEKDVTSLEEMFGVHFSYHPALLTNNSEEKYLRSLAKATLALILPDDVLMCESSEIIFVEIVAYKILKHVMTLMSDTNWLHEHMIILFSQSPADKMGINGRHATNEDIFPSTTNICVSSDSATSKNSSTLSSLAKHDGQVCWDNIPKVTFDIFEEETCNTPADSEHDGLNSCDDLVAGLPLMSKEESLPRSNTETSSPEPAGCSSVDPENSSVDQESSAIGKKNSAIDEKSSSVDQESSAIGQENSAIAHESSAICQESSAIAQESSAIAQESSAISRESSPAKEFSFSNVFGHSDTDNFIENISRKCKTTFQSLTKFDSLSQNNLPKLNILSTKVPSFSVCDNINEITVPRQRNVSQQRGEGDQMVEVECPEEALPTKGSEIIRLTMNDVDGTTDTYENMAGQTTDAAFKEDTFIYQDIDISRTEEFQEFRSNSKYTMYVIEYIALHFSDGGPVLRSGLVKRRFREFVNLQARLDDQSKYRNLLRDVKGPSRWATLPFKNRDKDSVESRRVFLDKFLKGLITVEAVCNGPELREFLAYEGDTHIAFVRKAPEITVPRIDKMFVRTVSEVFDRLKAIPDIPHNVMSNIIKRDRSVENLDIKKLDDTGQLEIDYLCAQTDQVEGLQIFRQDLAEFNSAEETNSEELNEHQELSPSKQCDYPDLLAQLPRLQGDGSEVSDKCINDVTDIPLTDAVFSLAVQALEGRQHWFCRQRIVKSLSVLIGKALNRWLGDQIEWLSSEERFAYYLTLLRESIWPNGQLSTEDIQDVSQEERKKTRNKAKQCLKYFLPGFLPVLAGETEYDYAMEQIMESLEYEKLNRHFLYTFLDVLVEKIFPELSTTEMQRNLLS